jgi:hypothetical protein
MKKYLAAFLIAIMAVSILGAAGVLTTQTAAGKLPGPTPWDPINPTPTNPPSWGSTVNVKLQVSPTMTALNPAKEQIILVTILYGKKTFNPFMGPLGTVKFGRTGTEAAPIAQYTADVNHDGMKDLTLAFRAKDLGLRPYDFCAKLTGTIQHPPCTGPNCPAVVYPPIYIKATALVWVV